MLPLPLKNLIDQLSKFPGLGQRSASRLAFYFLNQSAKDLNALARMINDLPTKVKTCGHCFNLTAGATVCDLCLDKKRRQDLICVVEDILDIVSIERTRQFNGVYHVLGGLIARLDGLTPDKLHIKELVSRVKQISGPSEDASGAELILALNPTIEGDTTILYLEKLLAPLKAKITRLNRGLSTGSDLKYADEATLINALKYRH